MLTRVLVASVVAFLLLTLVFHYALSQQQLDEINVHIEDNFMMLESEIHSQTKIRADWIRSAIRLIQHSDGSDKLSNALLAKDRKQLYKLASDHYRTLKQNNQITHIYFLDHERNVVLRMHQPDRYGDQINRVTARHAQQSDAVASGIELGPLGTLTLRVVAPWRAQGRVIGFLELGIELEAIINGIERDHAFQVVLMINKNQLDQALWVSGRKMLGQSHNWSMFPNQVVTYPEDITAFYPVIRDQVGNQDNLSRRVEVGGVLHGLKQVPFLDASGREIGQLIMLLDISIENIGLNHGMYAVMAIFVLLVVLFILFLYLLISRSERERDSAEARLELYGEAIANTIGGVIITDEQGTIIDVNSAFERVTGYSRDEAIGHSPSMLKSGQQESDFYSRMWETLLEQGQWQGRILNRRKNGEIYPEHLSITAIRDNHGMVKNYIGVFLETSEQEKLEEQFRQAQKMDALGTLVGGIAHEFNNMLAGMTGNLYLAMEEVKARPEVVEKLKIVESLSFQAAEMIKQLLTFARKGVMMTEQTDLSLFMRSSSDLFRLSVPENISMQYQITNRQLLVNVDRSQLQQVLVNLIDNARVAVRKSSDPEIRVAVDAFYADDAFLSRHHQVSATDFARISVIDNGVGIAQKNLEKIFEPFYTTKSVGEGAGLGLSMVYGAIECCGGVIEVDSKRRKGTGIHLYLPLLKPADDTISAEITDSGHGETILVVDDEPMVVETASKVLTRLGYQVVTASGGEEAIDLFQKHASEIGLVILDVVMPGMSGPETADAIKQMDQQVTIMFATGYDMTDTLEQRISHSGETVLRKPYQIAELAMLLKEIFNH